MKIKGPACLGFVLALMVSFSAYGETPDTTPHFFDPEGNALERFEPVWTALYKQYGQFTPDRILIRVTNANFSKFDVRSNTIMIKAAHYKQKWRAMEIVAHETVHLANHNLTNGHSLRNRFRFIDEGYASVFGKRLFGEDARYKQDVLVIAADQQRKDNVRLELVQDWKKYWGDWREDRRTLTNYAYPVGASFIYYLEDVYGEKEPLRFMSALGRTGNFNDASYLAFDVTGRQIEAGWITYMKNVRIAPAGPIRIVRMEPPNGATGVSRNRDELLVEFDTEMMREICVGTDSCDEICYSNAYWKSSKVLAIKLPKRLQSNETYSLSLGILERCRLRSRGLVDLPVTQWNFKTSQQ